MYSCIPPEKPQGEGFEYSYMDGTSMASPHVAGVAALLMAAHPSATVSEIATALKQTAEASGRRPQPTRQPLGVWHHPTPRRTQRTVFLKEAE